MKSNQKGIGHLALIVIILVLATIGATGWFVYKNQNKKTDNNSANTTSNLKSDSTSSDQTIKTDKADENKIDTTIYSLAVSLRKVEEVDKLPTYIPESFKTFIKSKITKSINEDNGCESKGYVYNITKASQVNIQGAVSASVPEGVTCPGGSGVLWVLTPDGNWDEIGLQSMPPCKSVNGGALYEEFAKDCSTDYVNRSNTVANPNGSIKSLTK